MPSPSPFQYAIVRVVPRVERGECLNAGVVLLCRPRRYLGARTTLDPARLEALDPTADVAALTAHLAVIDAIAAGEPSGGPIARLTQAERFHWLVAPSSTVIQPSEVHTGLTGDPAAELDALFEALVLPPAVAQNPPKSPPKSPPTSPMSPPASPRSEPS